MSDQHFQTADAVYRADALALASRRQLHEKPTVAPDASLSGSSGAPTAFGPGAASDLAAEEVGRSGSARPGLIHWMFSGLVQFKCLFRRTASLSRGRSQWIARSF